MPEMLPFCGRRFRVLKRADKTCDAINYTGSRRMINAVHLEGLRCNGEFHDGCQASCAFFWKESWLQRVPVSKTCGAPLARMTNSRPADNEGGCTVNAVIAAARTLPSTGIPESDRFYCQATELFTATAALPWWDIRQYMRDLVSGNVTLFEMIRWALIQLFNAIQRMRKGCEFPYIEGSLTRTPLEKLNLQPGDLVEVKSRIEIQETLDLRRRNRGLSFDAELFRSCGKRYRVRGRVNKIIDEKSGIMRKLANDSITLEGVTCSGFYRGLCPRGDFPFWREIWLNPLRDHGSDPVSTNRDSERPARVASKQTNPQ